MKLKKDTHVIVDGHDYCKTFNLYFALDYGPQSL